MPESSAASVSSAPSEDVSDSAVYIVELATGALERVSTESGAAAPQLCCAEWMDNTHLRIQEGTSNRFWLVSLGATPPESELLVNLTDSLALADLPGQVLMRSAPGDPGRIFHWQPVQAGQP